MKRPVARVLSIVLPVASGAALILFDPFDWRLSHRLKKGPASWLKLILQESDSDEGRLWTCGMHPQVIRQKQGSCPLCGMRLTPLKESTAGRKHSRELHTGSKSRHPHGSTDTKPTRPPDAQPEPGRQDIIRIDPVFVQNIGVQSVEVTRTDLSFTIRTLGNLVYDEAGMSWINARYEGWIEKAHVNYVGEPVEKGQELLEIYSPELVTTQQEYLQAIDYAARLSGSRYPDVAERARSLVVSSLRRLDHWHVDSEQIRQLEESREVRHTVTLVSPVTGVVVEKMDKAMEGMQVRPGMNLYRIADPSSLWVEAEIFEHQIPWLQIGQAAVVEIPSQPGRKFRAVIRYLSPSFDDRTRTLKVSLELIDPDPRLRSDMYANVIFDVSRVRGALAVSEESVIHSGRRNLVVLDRGNGRFQVREVTLGKNGNGFWEVREGLSKGDRVVISSQFLIDSESRLKEAIRKMVSRNGKGTGEKAPPPMSHQH